MPLATNLNVLRPGSGASGVRGHYDRLACLIDAVRLLDERCLRLHILLVHYLSLVVRLDLPISLHSSSFLVAENEADKEEDEADADGDEHDASDR